MKESMVSEGSKILGEVQKSIIFPGVRIGKGAKITNSVIFPETTIEDNAVVDYAIIAQDVTVKAGARVQGKEEEILVIAEGETVNA